MGEDENKKKKKTNNSVYDPCWHETFSAPVGHLEIVLD